MPLVNFVKNMVDDVDVSKMDAKILHNREEFARGMAHRTTRKKHAPPKVARSNPCEMACARGMAALITQYCAQKKVAVTQSIHEKCVSTTPGKKPVTRKLVPTSYAPLSSQTIGTPMAVLYQEPS